MSLLAINPITTFPHGQQVAHPTRLCTTLRHQSFGVPAVPVARSDRPTVVIPSEAEGSVSNSFAKQTLISSLKSKFLWNLISPVEWVRQDYQTHPTFLSNPFSRRRNRIKMICHDHKEIITAAKYRTPIIRHVIAGDKSIVFSAWASKLPILRFWILDARRFREVRTIVNSQS